MSTIRASPRVATGYMVVASLQFAAATGRFLPVAIGSNGWLLALVLVVIAALVLGIATMLQRILMPDRRMAFSFRYFLAGLAISLIGSITGLVT